MSKDNTIISGLDVTVYLSDSEVPLVESWLALLEERHTHIEAPPRITGKSLIINSTDLVALTGYIEPELVKTMECKRFFKRAKQGLDQALLRSVSVNTRTHYKWCLTALTSLEAGRFLPDQPE